MDTAAILAKAQEYIAAEKDTFFRSQIEELVAAKDFDQLNDRFFTDLEFGTGGMRGVIGGGYNRMNSLVVQRATQGLANYIRKAGTRKPASAVIAYDSRNFSDVFALEAAKVLAGNGIKTYLFSVLRPTPELSFAVRQLGATAGIVVTASHNPSQYNGYKVYWDDGGQVVPPHDNGIIAEVRAVKLVTTLTKDEALAKGLLVMIDKEVDDPFIAMVARQSLRPDLLKKRGAELKVVYTPLHGTGAFPVERALTALGITPIFVEEQRKPDGNFPTVKIPNPEEGSALKMAIDLARKHQAQLVLATDPDADRVGIAVAHKGEYVLVTGNQLGALLLDYVVNARKERGTLPQKAAFVKTIVTTELQRLICEKHGVQCFDVLTGFKFIGEKIREFEAQKDGPAYILGGEESYGFLVETEVRDKDAVSAATMAAEMTLYHLTNGKTPIDRLNELYLEHGYFQELVISRHFEGEAGQRIMGALMERLRANPPAELAGEPVALVRDYRDSVTVDVKTGSRVKNIALPSANVLQFVMANGSVVTARPSGTEPKIKFYASCCGRAGEPLASARAAVQRSLSLIEKNLDAIIAAA